MRPCAAIVARPARRPTSASATSHVASAVAADLSRHGRGGRRARGRRPRRCAAPSAAKRRARAAPMPLPPPVTTTTHPVDVHQASGPESADDVEERGRVGDLRGRQQRDHRRADARVGVRLDLLPAGLGRAVQHEVVDDRRPGSPQRRPPDHRPPTPACMGASSSPAAEPVVERGVGRHGQVGGDQQPAEVAGVLGVLGRADEDPRDDLGGRRCRSPRHTGRRRSAASQLRIAPSASRPASAQHLRPQRGEQDRRRLRPVPARA